MTDWRTLMNEIANPNPSTCPQNPQKEYPQASFEDIEDVCHQEDRAKMLLANAEDKVRAVTGVDVQIGDAIYLNHGEGPLLVSMVDMDAQNRQWVLVREPDQIRWINTKFVITVERH